MMYDLSIIHYLGVFMSKQDQLLDRAQEIGGLWLEVIQKNTEASFALAHTALGIRSADEGKAFLTESAQAAREGFERIAQAAQQSVQHQTATTQEIYEEAKKTASRKSR